MKVGYIRVSTSGQNIARQELMMDEQTVDKVYSEKISGKNTARPMLQEMMTFVREGDTVVVESISRFARCTKDLLDLVEQLNSKGVAFVSLKENIDTKTPQGKFTLTIFAAIAELERESIKERQAEGIAIAKAEGKFNGRPIKKINKLEEVYSAWQAKKLTATAASKQLGIARSSFYRRVKQLEENNNIDFGG
ncbi:MAG: recombinase family protein [Oscillospiraceae bacterium]